MLDSIREIFDISGYRFEAIEFSFEEYHDGKQLVAALKAGKCPVINVPNSYLNPNKNENGSQVMLATGMKNESAAQFIQMKNSYADDPNEQGKIPFCKISSHLFFNC